MTARQGALLAAAWLAWVAPALAAEPILPRPSEREALPLSGPAYALADAAYQAFARADYARAASLAREAIRQRPDFVPLQRLLAQSESAQRAPTSAPSAPAMRPSPRRSSGTAGNLGATGFTAAAAAYAAYDRADFARAVDEARRAVALAPGERRYRQLLVNSLAAAGRNGEALRAGEAGIEQTGDDGSLAATLVPIRRALALAPARAAFAALGRGDAVAAIASAREAVRLAPAEPRYRIVLVEALLRGELYADAEAAAGPLISPAAADPVALALRGYARQRLGRLAEAAADFDRAIGADGIDAAQRFELRLIAADAALAAPAPQRAIDLLRAAPRPDGAAVLDRLGEARAALSAGSAAYPLPPLRLDCSGVAETSTCRLGAGIRPVPGSAAAAAAYRAYAGKRYGEAADLAALAVEAAPAEPTYRGLQIEALIAAGRVDEAETAAGAALAVRPGDAGLLARRGLIRRRQGREAEARADLQAAVDAGGLAAPLAIDALLALGRQAAARERFESALQTGELGVLSSLDQAFLAVRVGADAQAMAAFKAADAAGQLHGSTYGDAAYAALRAGDDAGAIGYFGQRIDSATTDSPAPSPQALFETRRAVSEVSRTAGVFASLLYGGTMPGTGLAAGSRAHSLQAGVEAYWRPWGYRDGRYAELFARAFQTLASDDGGTTGAGSRQAAIGLRDKPFKSLNLVASVSRVLSARGGRDDWLAQLGYSGGYGTDLRIDAPAWWTTRVFAETGRYLSSRQTYALAHAEAGRSLRLGDGDGRWVLFPHLSLAADRDSKAAERSAAGFGAGVAARYWFREDALHAPRSYIDLSLQYRARIEGGARGGGPFVALSVAY